MESALESLSDTQNDKGNPPTNQNEAENAEKKEKHHCRIHKSYLS